jgi:hypothetical protein
VAQFIAIILSLVAIVTAFFSVLWTWVVLAVPIALLLITFMGLKQKRWKHIPELSEPANAMLQKFGHYYTMPFAGRDFSASCSTLMFAGVVIAVIGAFKGFWWGLAIAVANWVVMGFLSRAFNPTNFIADPLERLAHEEVISFIVAKQKTGTDT